MIEFYLQIKWVHVAAVLTSGGLFALRGIAMLAGARWYMAAPLRYLSYTIDTVLLTAAMMLATVLHQYPFVNGWLTTKVLLLVVYVVLGSLALKRGATRSRACLEFRRRTRGVRLHHQRGPGARSSWRVRLARAVAFSHAWDLVSTHCRGAPRYFTYTRAN